MSSMIMEQAIYVLPVDPVTYRIHCSNTVAFFALVANFTVGHAILEKPF